MTGYATVKDLKEFLLQFPEDTEIELVHYTEYPYGGYGRTSYPKKEDLHSLDEDFIEHNGWYKGSVFEYHPHSKSLTLGVID
ncbi:hypothetical protein CPT_Mendera_091 [Stenotrophomonas phage Mendera]|uniref:Uncharacterized protein n=1 Tax=Stenotrophomonas phage Mendera TaxID=2650877 RepID=A0A5P8PKT8_9CAUD|nr:hypothetical protein HWC60_gp091 [Stenotrophomonas phage Mendera]QFR56640.1 hypothetical protein CPT_Mendera_091 [Stenotrophomonas phage Mendera]